jgi:hypothetical protein
VKENPMSNLKKTLQRVASAHPETRPIIIPFLRRHATCACGDDWLSEELDEVYGEGMGDELMADGDEMMAARRFFGPLDGKKNRDYAKGRKHEYNWNPKNRGKGKCYYETGDEADRCYVTTNGGPGGQTKPDTGPAGKDYSNTRKEYNKKYHKQYLKERKASYPEASKTAAGRSQVQILEDAVKAVEKQVAEAKRVVRDLSEIASPLGPKAVALYTKKEQARVKDREDLLKELRQELADEKKKAGKQAEALLASIEAEIAQRKSAMRLAELRTKLAAADYYGYAEDKDGNMVRFFGPAAKASIERSLRGPFFQKLLDDGGTTTTSPAPFMKHDLSPHKKTSPWFKKLPKADKTNLDKAFDELVR